VFYSFSVDVKSVSASWMSGSPPIATATLQRGEPSKGAKSGPSAPQRKLVRSPGRRGRMSIDRDHSSLGDHRDGGQAANDISARSP
jgi:hypothetical protein